MRGSTGDDDAALVVTQETFIAAFAALKNYDGTRPFKIWVARVALNKCRDWARRRAVGRFFSFARPIEAAENISADSIPADQLLANRAELAPVRERRVRERIAKLPPTIRELLILRAIEGLTLAETAEILDISERRSKPGFIGPARHSKRTLH